MTQVSPPTAPVSQNQAVAIAQTAQDKKAEDVLVLEVGGLTSLADYFVFASGESERQVRAIANTIEKMMSTQYETHPNVEGKEKANWILMDYGDIIVHIFRSDVRQYYALEKMWADAPQIAVPESASGLRPSGKASSTYPMQKVVPHS